MLQRTSYASLELPPTTPQVAFISRCAYVQLTPINLGRCCLSSLFEQWQHGSTPTTTEHTSFELIISRRNSGSNHSATACWRWCFHAAMPRDIEVHSCIAQHIYIFFFCGGPLSDEVAPESLLYANILAIFDSQRLHWRQKGYQRDWYGDFSESFNKS